MLIAPYLFIGFTLLKIHYMRKYSCWFQLDQGLGIGSKNPLFNRHQLTMTKFINLNNPEKGAGKPLPAVLVLHGHYAGCVGDLPSYDAFALGGPYSVRGFTNGELGAGRNILEVCFILKLSDDHSFANHVINIDML
jgi:outer membrane protein assembly factor BamA